MNKENITLFKKMITYSIPLAFGGLLSVLMGLIDAFYLTSYSLDAFKALVLIVPVMGIVGSIGIGIGSALVNAMASHTGQEKRNTVYLSTLILMLLCFVFIVIVVILFHNSFAAFNDLQDNSHQHILTYYSQYWYAIIPFYFFLLILNITSQYLSFKGNNREIIIILLIIVSLNLALNPICIFLLNMGVVGAAIASILSLLLGNFYFALKEQRLTKLLTLVQASYNWHVLKPHIISQARVALSVFLAIAIFAIGSIFFNQLAIQEGHEFLALVGLTEQLKLLMIFPTRGVTGAFFILFEKNLAQNNVSKYWTLYWCATMVIGIICLTEALAILFFSENIFSAFNLGDTSSRQLLWSLFISLCFYYLVSILPRASQVAFISLGKSYLLFLQSLFSILFGYAFTWYLIRFHGKAWFIDGQTLGVFVATIYFLLKFRQMLNHRIEQDRLKKNVIIV